MKKIATTVATLVVAAGIALTPTAAFANAGVHHETALVPTATAGVPTQAKPPIPPDDLPYPGGPYETF